MLKPLSSGKEREEGEEELSGLCLFLQPVGRCTSLCIDHIVEAQVTQACLDGFDVSGECHGMMLSQSTCGTKNEMTRDL